MKLIKLKTPDGWYSLYLNFLNKCLRKDKNLSDLTDKDAALENLQLIGDNVNSHYHDDHYLPMIQASEDKVINQLEQFEKDVATQINKINNSSDELKENIEEKLDKDLIAIQANAPANPKDNMIWICTDPNDICVKVYVQAAWLKIGAPWK